MSNNKPIERITKAAIKAFRENGVQNTTMEDIAKLANISRPNIYRYVQNRNELLKIVVLDCAANILSEIKPIAGSWHEVLADLFVQQVQLALKNDIFMGIVEQAGSSAAKLLVEDQDVQTSLNQAFLPALAAGHEANELREDIKQQEILYWLHYQTWCLTRDPKAHNRKEMKTLVKKFVVGGLVKH